MEDCTPGPGQYADTELSVSTQRRMLHPSSAFMSRAPRLARPVPSAPVTHILVGEHTTPPVGAYDVHSKPASAPSGMFDDAGGTVRAGGCVDPRVAARAAAAKERVSFSSTAPRLGPGNPLAAAVGDTPGPGAYSPPGSGSPRRKGMKPAYDTLELRFHGPSSYRKKPSTSEQVGPGAYRLEGSMVRKSHNVTMNGKFRPPPSKRPVRGSLAHPPPAVIVESAR